MEAVFGCEQFHSTSHVRKALKSVPGIYICVGNFERWTQNLFRFTNHDDPSLVSTGAYRTLPRRCPATDPKARPGSYFDGFWGPFAMSIFLAPGSTPPGGPSSRVCTIHFFYQPPRQDSTWRGCEDGEKGHKQIRCPRGGGAKLPGGERNQIGPNSPHSSEDKPGGK